MWPFIFMCNLHLLVFQHWTCLSNIFDSLHTLIFRCQPTTWTLSETLKDQFWHLCMCLAIFEMINVRQHQPMNVHFGKATLYNNCYHRQRSILISPRGAHQKGNIDVSQWHEASVRSSILQGIGHLPTETTIRQATLVVDWCMGRGLCISLNRYRVWYSYIDCGFCTSFSGI